MEEYTEKMYILYQDLQPLPFCPRDVPLCFPVTQNVFAQKHIQVKYNLQFYLKKKKVIIKKKKKKNQKMLLHANLGLPLAFI